MYLFFDLNINSFFRNDCWCGNQYGYHGFSTNCYQPCIGNQNETCGGYLSNSVYELNPGRFFVQYSIKIKLKQVKLN